MIPTCFALFIHLLLLFVLMMVLWKIHLAILLSKLNRIHHDYSTNVKCIANEQFYNAGPKKMSSREPCSEYLELIHIPIYIYLSSLSIKH